MMPEYGACIACNPLGQTKPLGPNHPGDFSGNRGRRIVRFRFQPQILVAQGNLGLRQDVQGRLFSREDDLSLVPGFDPWGRMEKQAEHEKKRDQRPAKPCGGSFLHVNRLSGHRGNLGRAA